MLRRWPSCSRSDKAKLAPGVLIIGPMGPRGLQGPAGPSGQAGPQGVAGPAGGPLDSKRVLHVPGPILGGAPGALFINIAAPCPAGGIALGGGCTISGTVHVSSSIASDFQQGWQITATDC